VEVSERECAGCGAPVQIRTEPVRPVDIENLEAEILKVFVDFEDMDVLHSRETVPAKKLRNARKSFNILPEEKVILVYDNTVFGSNKDGFALCETGIYWKKTWLNDSKRSYITWDEFARRDVWADTENYDFHLGRGDVLSITQGNAKRMVKFLIALKRIFGTVRF